MGPDVEEAPPTSSNSEGVTRSSWIREWTPAVPVDEWIKYLSQEALIYQETVREFVDSGIAYSRTRLSEILSTASAHSQMTLEGLQGVISDLSLYEHMAVEKVKDGVHVASSHPFICGAITAGLAAVIFKRPRRFIYYRALPLFVSEESMILRAESEVKELRHSFNIFKAESEKLERRALSAEEEFVRGRTKLRQAGKQIQNAIHSAYKVQRQAAGLKGILDELPGREGSKFQKQVKALVSDVKQEKNVLAKEVNKINNYGISV